MSDRSEWWGSKDQGSSRSKGNDGEYRRQQEKHRHQDRERNTNQNERSELPRKQEKPDHYSNYASTDHEYKLQVGHKTKELKVHPKAKGYWAPPDATEQEKKKYRYMRTGVADGRDGISRNDHLNDRIECSEGNSRVMGQSAQHGIEVRDMCYGRDHLAHRTYRNMERSISPSTDGSRPGSSRADDPPSPKGKGKGRAK
jgi:hypothetical protein